MVALMVAPFEGGSGRPSAPSGVNFRLISVPSIARDYTGDDVPGKGLDKPEISLE